MKTQTRTTAAAVVLLTRLARSVYRHVDEDALGMGLKEFVMLSAVRESGGTTQRELVDVMHGDANLVVQLLNSLEGRGYALRERDPQDRRRHIVRITSAGRKALVRGERALESVTDETLGWLDDEERSTLRLLLAKALGPRAFAASASE
jgi:DNA-binding MarR family transcriptional regulator